MKPAFGDASRLAQACVTAAVSGDEQGREDLINLVNSTDDPRWLAIMLSIKCAGLHKALARAHGNTIEEELRIDSLALAQAVELVDP